MTDTDWEQIAARYREERERNPSRFWPETLRTHLERVRLNHQKLMDAKARTEAALLALPAEVLEDIPVESQTAARFADLADDARTMVDRWEDLANEYDLLARRIRELIEEEAQARAKYG